MAWNFFVEFVDAASAFAEAVAAAGVAVDGVEIGPVSSEHPAHGLAADPTSVGGPLPSAVTVGSLAVEAVLAAADAGPVTPELTRNARGSEISASNATLLRNRPLDKSSPFLNHHPVVE